MSISFHYRNADGDIVEFTERVDLADRAVKLMTNAEQGSVASCELVVDDPLGDWDIGGHRLVYVHEDEADFVRVWVGYTASRKITRLDPMVGASRQWTLNLVDLNSLLARRIMVGTDCNRPAESDVERMQWLASTTEWGFVDDTTNLSTANPVDMDAVDYRGQFASQVADDCSQQSGKNWYLYPALDGTDQVYALWYANPFATGYNSSLRISNVIADEDGDLTFYPFKDAELVRDPSRVYSGVYMPYDGGNTYRQRATTITNFAARDTNAPMVNVKTIAKANARANRYLEAIHTEEDVITVTIEVPPNRVNEARQGMRLEAKFTHLPGYEAFSFMRVLNRTVTFVTPEKYEITYTLSGEAQEEAPPTPPDFDLICTANGYVVPTCVGASGVELAAGPILLTPDPPLGSHVGGRAAESASVLLYDGATYHFVYTAIHATTNFECNLGMAMDREMFGFANMGNFPPMPGPAPLNGYEYDFTMPIGAGNRCYAMMIFEGAGYAGCNNIGSSGTMTVTYRSGPDPRFVDLPACP